MTSTPSLSASHALRLAVFTRLLTTRLPCRRLSEERILFLALLILFFFKRFFIFRDKILFLLLDFLIKDLNKVDEVINILDSASGEIIKNLFIFDFYKDNKKSSVKLGCRFIFQSNYKTLSDAEINEKALEIINPIIEIQSTEVTSPNQVEEDATFARNNMKDLIIKGNNAMDQLLAVAKESEHPRAYEVAAGLIKNLADMNKDLLELQKRRRDLSPNQEGFAGNAKSLNVDKAIFVGSTNELVKFLKNNK